MILNILLVDDNARFRKEFRDCLEGFGIIEASDGEQALNILKDPNEIDLVILDVMMPGMRGTEVLKRIKMLYPDLSIVIFTGYGSKEIAVEALKGHADDYIEKPIKIRNAREIIERILEVKRGDPDLEALGITGKIERVKHFIEKNYDKKISLKLAARIVCLSPKYLSKIFKKNTGMGFNEYKLEVKTKMGKELLNNTGYNVGYIAYKLGYKNTESFLRAFKKFYGCTPTRYRKKTNLNHISMEE